MAKIVNVSFCLPYYTCMKDAVGLLSKVKVAKHANRRWCLSSYIPTGKYEKTDRANEFYKSEVGVPIIPTSTERSITFCCHKNQLV